VTKYQIAQVNIGRIKAPLDSSTMAGFMGRLDEINALADNSPGFVWRLQTQAGNATYFRPYEHDDRILLNMSVWETVEDLRNYVYRTTHAELLRQRQEWFEKFAGVYAALWWVPADHIPGIDEAKKRLAHLEKHGPTEFAFSLKRPFRPMRNFSRESIGHRSCRALLLRPAFTLRAEEPRWMEESCLHIERSLPACCSPHRPSPNRVS
jgi:hypothetical protein